MITEDDANKVEAIMDFLKKHETTSETEMDWENVECKLRYTD